MSPFFVSGGFVPALLSWSNFSLKGAAFQTEIVPRRRPSIRTRPFGRLPGAPAGSKRRAGRAAMRHAGTDQGRGSSEDARRAFRAMHTSSLVPLIIVFWDRIFPSSCGLVVSFFQSACWCIHMPLYVTKYSGVFSMRKFEGASRDSSMLSKTSAPERMFRTVSHVRSGNFSRAM